MESLEKKYGKAERVWVMDRGMVSEKNRAFLRSRNGRYIVGTPRVLLRQFERQLLEGDWQEVQEGVEVKIVEGPSGNETFLLAKSVERRKRPRARST